MTVDASADEVSRINLRIEGIANCVFRFVLPTHVGSERIKICQNMVLRWDRMGSVNESSDRRLGLVLVDSEILGFALGSS